MSYVTLLTVVAVPHAVLAKIATAQTTIVEVYAPGSAKGMKFGAVAIAWPTSDNKAGVEIVLLTETTKVTAPGKERLRFADLKIDSEVVVTHFDRRGTGTPPQALANRIIVLAAAKK